MRAPRSSLALALFTMLCARVASAADGTTAGDLTLPHPTLHNLSIEWTIAGDDDLDGQVKVRVRPVGGAFRDAPPLRRVPAGSNEGFSWTNRHAGSIFGLDPATTYEVELTLDDPDGGGETRTAQATTRPVPPVLAGPGIAVTPATIEQALGAAKPGDLLVLGPGSYPTVIVPNDGSAAAPIVLRGQPGAVIDGDVRLDGRSSVFVESLTIKGKIKLNGATGVVVRGCTIDTPGEGIVAFGSGSTDGYFADNIINGPTAWSEGALGVNGDNLGEGIQLAGAGNVIAHNRVRGFRDCISLLEDGEAVDQRSIDIFGNDLSVCADDAIEADFSMGNVRVYGNRVTSSFVGMSSQPSLGGPTYFVRNAMFGVVYSPFKLHRGSVGDVIVHNTVVKNGDALGIYAGKTWSRALFRNNLFLGGTGGGTFNGFDVGQGQVAVLADADASCDLDFDGFGSIGTGTFSGRIGPVKFSSLAELNSLTSEKHAVSLGLDALNPSVSFPTSPFPEAAPQDLRLSDASAAVDKGTPLPGLNDGFEGQAPDLGAYEGKAPLPVYGPRPDGAAGAGGSAGAGGQAGSGAAGEGGQAQGGAGTGGSASGTGGSASGAGGSASGTGGSASGAGGSASGAGGSASGTGGSASGTGGSASGTGGSASGTGGSASGTAGKAGAAGGQAGSGSAEAGEASGDDGGCGCRAVGGRGGEGGAWWLALVALVGARMSPGARRRARLMSGPHDRPCLATTRLHAGHPG